MMSACGVWCSACPAFQGRAKGPVHQKRTADAWQRIYSLSEAPENISCGGCLGPDEQLFHGSRTCAARRCCRDHLLHSCGECPKRPCEDLERAQALWDGVPQLASTLSHGDFLTYAQPYCGHRRRIAGAARVGRRRARD